jgi:hypothetical protein
MRRKNSTTLEQVDWCSENARTLEEDAESSSRLARSTGRFIRRAAPILGRVARVAAPIVGPRSRDLLRSRRSSRSKRASGPTLPSEEQIVADLLAQPGVQFSRNAALAESTASIAACADEAKEAELLVTAVVTLVVLEDDEAVRSRLPEYLRGIAPLARALSRSRVTRPAIRVIPTIVGRTVRAASGGAFARGRHINRTLALEIHRVFDDPYELARALYANLRETLRGPRVD